MPVNVDVGVAYVLGVDPGVFDTPEVALTFTLDIGGDAGGTALIIGLAPEGGGSVTPPVYLGAAQVTGVYYGATPITALYLGAVKLWP